MASDRDTSTSATISPAHEKAMKQRHIQLKTIHIRLKPPKPLATRHSIPFEVLDEDGQHYFVSVELDWGGIIQKTPEVLEQRPESVA